MPSSVWHTTGVSASSRSPIRPFQAVQADLENAILRLRRSYDPSERFRLLRVVRTLIEEADTIIDQPSHSRGHDTEARQRHDSIFSRFPEECRTLLWILLYAARDEVGKPSLPRAS